MSPTWNDHLLQATVLTFEALCFIWPDEELSPSQHQGLTPDATVSVEFRGVFHGRLQLSLYGDLLPLLAANMLGQDEAPPQPLQVEALGEVANVICGNLLPQLAGPFEVFQVETPQLRVGAETTIDASMAHMAAVQLGLEQGRAELDLYLESASS